MALTFWRLVLARTGPLLGLAGLATLAVLLVPHNNPLPWLVVLAAWAWAIRAVQSDLRQDRVLAESVDQLFVTVERWAGGDLDARVYLDSDDPLDALAHGMNRVAEVLAERTRDLVQDKDRLEAILSSLTTGVVIVDRALYITLVNQAAIDLFGLPADGPVGRHVIEVIRATAIENALQAVTRSGQPRVIDWSPDPTSDTLIECSMAPVGQRGGGFGAILVARDITAQRRLDRMRADFVANVSHELQTPLTTIIGFAEALADNTPPPEEAHRYLTLIHDEAGRLSRVVDDLLALSRLEHHSLPARQEAVDMDSLLEQVRMQMGPRAEQAGLQFTIHVDGRPVALGDRDLLHEVLINLVSNAIQYTQPGGRIEGRAAASDHCVKLAVADTGIGIPSGDLPRIFERFYRVDRDRSRRSGGTGLGLAIVKHIVELHRGQLTVESEPGRGSVFTVTLPEAPEHPPGGDGA
jgi:two-component system phosphate regulon sensor histidine kinase PhoR